MAVHVSAHPDLSPRDPQATPLHRVVRDHLATFLADRALRDSDGQGVPSFITRELLAFLRCGVLAFGLARFRCDECSTSRVVALSCKGRGFCPRCGGRRMTERARDLATNVFPRVRVRQWVLSLPFALRYAVAFDHELGRAIWTVAVRAIEAHYRRVPREPSGRTGCVTTIQRFGGDLRCNPHYHGLFVDGLYVECPDGKPRFVKAPRPTAADVAAILESIVSRVQRLVPDDDELRHRVGETGMQSSDIGVQRFIPEDAEVRLPSPDARAKARIDGFDLDAAVSVSRRNRDDLERLCRYILRPAISNDRLSVLGDGRIALTLKRPWSDGSTHVVFTPDAFLSRLATLVPRPRINTTLYHGVLAAHSKLRRHVVPRRAPAPRAQSRNVAWSELMRHAFGVDVLSCGRCAGRLRFVAVVMKPAEVRRILTNLGLPTDPLPIRPARPPPEEAYGLR